MLQRSASGKGIQLGRWSASTIGLLAMALYLAIAGAGYLHSADPAQAQPGAAKADAEKRIAANAADLYGDALPPGAIARLGTVRFRSPTASIAYSPDGKLIAAGGADNHIRLFDVSSGKIIRQLAGHQARTFNPPRDNKTAFDALVGSTGQGNVTTVAF